MSAAARSQGMPRAGGGRADGVIRVAAGVTVVALAGIAGAISYSHMRGWRLRTVRVAGPSHRARYQQVRREEGSRLAPCQAVNARLRRTGKRRLPG